MKLAIRHLSGSRANRVDSLALPPEREITFGRDRECHVRYDEADDLVSRKHLKIVATDEKPVRYMVVDLGSRNGTFINRKRVFGAVHLLPGGRIQLGAGGPEFEFQLDTGEARIRKPWFAAGVLVVLLLAAAGAASHAAWPRIAPLWRDWQRARAVRAAKPTFTAAEALASIAGVEAEWNLFDKHTGARLARACIANERIPRAERVPLVEGAPAILPVFIVGEDRRIEPLLVPAGTAHAGRAVGGKWASKGVIVSETGAVLTAAPAQRPWEAACPWTAEESAGALLVLESRNIMQVVPLAATQFPRCAPTESGFFAEQLPGDLQGDVRGRRVSRNDLRVEVTASIAVSGRTLKAKLAGESSGIWLAATEPGIPLDGIRVPLLDDSATRPKTSQLVWVVGNDIEAAEIQDTPAEGLIAVRASRCVEGGVVFDQDGRVLALCIPDAHSKAGSGIAVRVRGGLALIDGAADGQSR